MCEVANMWKLLKPLISIAVMMMMKTRMQEDALFIIPLQAQLLDRRSRLLPGLSMGVVNAATNEQFRIRPICATHSSVILAIHRVTRHHLK
ncbi:hypothetical protein Pmar_PMAR019335 [Perkinsus marinus ATCC 50983]|uniref:Uncharacterized protein n=1 Tax=Perkinsus marinus (strain ATCC 50983 / TXsc) TaxID=423536 RepID=C5KFV2_PERM5|nr:hypothetical protein Pmar_PMAR019335 [Perkinsus marinus ATCC 50983]EER16654.1 hypothetical protein Pmar_PMAR019335 [Perkinsus marinus ATCC 50983]|eukprot:XP_002784858.1 hypothetical protein Pmar_PMAR019335 [Perkinsus marinus ATCC 50983]